MEETVACVQHDLDQALLQWLSLSSTQTWIESAAQESRAGRDIPAFVIPSVAPSTGHTAGSPAPGGQWLGRAIPSPRRSSPSTPLGGAVGSVSRARGTPPMSPNASNIIMRGSPQSPSRTGAPGSPPGSPRHFTFGVDDRAEDQHPSPGGIALSAAGSMRSPPQPLPPTTPGGRPHAASPPLHHSGSGGFLQQAHLSSQAQHQQQPAAETSAGVPALESLSPSEVGGSPIRGSRGGFDVLRSPNSSSVSPSSPLPPSAASGAAASPSGAGQQGGGAVSTPQQATGRASGSPSPSPSPSNSTINRAAMIAAANSEAFPVASPAGGAATTRVSPSGAVSAASPIASPGARPGHRGPALTLHDMPASPHAAAGSPQGGERKDGEGSSPSAAGHVEPRPTLSLADAAATHSPLQPPLVAQAPQQLPLSQAAPAAAAVSSASLVSFNHVPAQGGRGRGRPISGERLEDKLDAILELFQRQLVTPPPPPPPVLLRRNGAGELPTSFTDVGVEVAGVRLSWQDAHAFCAVEQFAAVAKTLCGFPSFFAAPLLRRIRHQYGAEKVAVGYGVDSVASSPEWRTLTPAEEAAQVAALTGGGSAARGPSAGEESKHSGSDFVVRRSIVLNLGPERPSAPEDLADRDVSTHVSLPAFLTYWRAEMEPYDACDRFLRLVSKRSGASARGVGRVMESADFMPFMEELLAFHPGLAFLESTPEFQEKYARTVIARIFYVLDPTARRCIDARQLRRSNLLDAFHTVDIEEDINMVNDYFSYEHFYVLYCKFWELDTDHDFLLSRPDLNKLMDLTHVVLDRVFSQAGRPFTSGKPGKMGYEDFIVFFMSEEDKSTESALRFWFTVCDLDGDGVLTTADLRPFYRVQEQRMRDLGMEVIAFEDVFCQMHDLLKPATEGRILLSDFLHRDRCKLTGVLFSAMFNLTKFQQFEARDPYLVKQELNKSGTTQWDRYAQQEYQRLASEEEEASAATTSAQTVGQNGGGIGAGALAGDHDDDFMGRLLGGNGA